MCSFAPTFRRGERGDSMRGQEELPSRKDQSFLKIGRQLQHWALLGAAIAAPVFLNGCAGITSASNTSAPPPPPSTVNITNVQAASLTTSSSQIVWTTDVAANSQVDYGTTTSYGSSTPVDSTMVTNHQVTLSGLAAGTTYYYQVSSTDAKSNNGHSGGHGFKTAGFVISGTINPAATGGSGATLALSGAASFTTTADSSGNYIFSGLPNGTYTVAPSHAGYTFTPGSQSTTVNGSNITGVNFTASASTAVPAITAQPANQTVSAGQVASFTVVATGTAPLTYQWEKNGASIGGATSASYTTPATTTSDSGATFGVVVSNTAGAVVSASATLTVTAATVAPTITAQPVSLTVTAGQTASFVVSATGTAPLTYQWQKNGVNIAGGNSASYTSPTTTTSDNGASFRVMVSNTAGTATSAAATLTVTAATVAPTITAQPVNQTVTAGQTASFMVAATGTAPLTYQWQKNGANIAGANSASYTTPATTTADNGASFRAVVSNTAGSVSSATAILTVNAAVVAPAITTQPVNQTVTAGQTATFSVAATGTAPLSYQWQRSGVNIAGANSASYTTPATTTSDNGATFDAVVSNTAGTITSAAATLTVNAVPAPAIQVNPTSMTFTNTVVGSSSSQPLIIKNTGTATLTISQLTASGSGFGASGFSLPLNVGAGQQLTITVAFVAPAIGPASGNLAIVSNAVTSPTSVGLSGTGIAATFTLGINPGSLTFGNVTTGTSSAAQNVVITNTGNSSVAISQITLSGAGYTMTGGNVPLTLTPSQSVTLSVQFSPNFTGPANGSISIVSNAVGSPVSVSLTGTGVVQHSVALSWIASSSSVAGYNVYRSTVSGGAYARISSSLVGMLSYSDSTVQNGTTYYYVTTAVDSQGVESVFSNQVVAVIP